MLLVQGDVFLVRVEKMPAKACKVEKAERGYIIAEGEATGHAHVIDADIECYEKDKILYIKTQREVPLSHEEHTEILVPPGIWKVGIVQEYDAFQEEARNVRD